MPFERITVEPDKMGGQPCIRGLQIPVATVVGMVADGMTPQQIVEELPDLEAEDVAEALRYVAQEYVRLMAKKDRERKRAEKLMVSMSLDPQVRESVAQLRAQARASAGAADAPWNVSIPAKAIYDQVTAVLEGKAPEFPLSALVEKFAKKLPP